MKEQCYTYSEEDFVLSSNHKWTLSRWQPRAMTIGHNFSQDGCTAGSRLAAESSAPRADWVDPTRSEDVPLQEVGALKKRLVASERERKQALADAAADNRALHLQLQVRRGCVNCAVLCCAVLASGCHTFAQKLSHCIRKTWAKCASSC